MQMGGGEVTAQGEGSMEGFPGDFPGDRAIMGGEVGGPPLPSPGRVC